VKKIKAAVVRQKGGPFQIEELTQDEPRSDEVRVRIVATGMCHTDMVARDQLYEVPLPVVLGHEGSGVVEQIGSHVKKVAVGDHVVRPLQALPARRFDLLRAILCAEFQWRTRRRQHINLYNR